MRRSIQTNTLISTALLALIITANFQLMRVFFPSVAWYLKDTIGVESTTLALYVLIIMNVGFLSALLNKLMGQTQSILLTAGGIALTRVLEQLIHSPSVDLWISMVGCSLFALFLPNFIAHIRAKGMQLAGTVWAYGLFLGLALDSTIHGLSRTLDLSWIQGLFPVIVILIQGFAIIVLLLLENYPSKDALTETNWRENLAFIALGPFLVLQLLIFQNQGWVSLLSGVSSDWGYILVMFANFLAVGGVFAAFKYQRFFQPTLSMIVGLLVAALSFITDQPGTIFVFTLLLTQLLFGWCWAHMGTLTTQATRRSLGRTTVMTTVGLLIFILLAFIYYAALDIPLPFYREAILPASGVLFAITYLSLALQARRATTMTRSIIEPIVLSGALLVISLFYLVFQPPSPRPEIPTGRAVKIMTYNIHSAYNIKGRQDPEAIALVIEKSGADIVAVQEISRGWLVNGSTDLTGWLSKRLGMQILFQGTTGPMWGNAILSRYPILKYKSGDLPALGTSLERGYLWAVIDTGLDQPINIFATHLHHIEGDPIVRYAQLKHLLQVWEKLPQSIILGDLNARPEDSEIKLLIEAGLIDSWSEAGLGAGNTFSSDDPFKRIDWIWHTPDLTALDAKVLESTASDHLPVMITLEASTK